MTILPFRLAQCVVFGVLLTQLLRADDKPSPVRYRAARAAQSARVGPRASETVAQQVSNSGHRASTPNGTQVAAHTPLPDGDGLETGYAAFYSDDSDGHMMSNGEAFDSGRLTAAHRTLPFGSRVRVTNLANGNSVIVAITDRGAGGRRIINVSRRAAELLGFVASGTAQVRLDPAVQQ